MIKIEFDNPKELSEIDKAKVVGATMIRDGRGFIKHLGKKLSQMDIEEIREFKTEFPSYWRKYSEMAECNND